MIFGGIFINKLIILVAFLLNTISLKTNQTFTYVSSEINIFKNDDPIFEKIKKEEIVPVLATYHGLITAYGPDCVGCKTGKTASGYNVLHGNIYYNDKEYGKVRIVAADKSLPFGSIIRIRDLDVFKEDVIAIVLDRGGAIGFNKKVYFDLLYKSEKDTHFFGKRTATFELLRRGY